MIGNQMFKKVKEIKYVPTCLVCAGKMTDTMLANYKVCQNKDCSNYNILVMNWYEFEEE